MNDDVVILFHNGFCTKCGGKGKLILEAPTPIDKDNKGHYYMVCRDCGRRALVTPETAFDHFLKGGNCGC